MDNESIRQQSSRTLFWPHARPAVWCTMAGAAVTLVTVILSATRTISSGQAFALALPATTIILGGLIGMTVPDAWTAWRRGFQHGCEAALKSKSSLMGKSGKLSSEATVALAGRRGRRAGHMVSARPRLARLASVAQLRVPVRGVLAASDHGLPLAQSRGDVLDAEQGEDLGGGGAGSAGDPLD